MSLDRWNGQHLPNEKGPFLRLDALDYRRQCDEALATGAAIVTATLDPYNPQVASGGIPAEHVIFKVSGVPTSTRPYLRCTVTVFHVGQAVGTTSMGAGASLSRSSTYQADVQVNGQNFAGQPSDAHVVCSTTTDPIGH